MYLFSGVCFASWHENASSILFGCKFTSRWIFQSRAKRKNSHDEKCTSWEPKREKKMQFKMIYILILIFFFSFHYFAQRRCPLCCCSRSSELGAQDEWLYSWETNKKLLRQPQRINCAACAAWAINIYVERVKSEWMFLTYKSKWQKDDIRTILCTLFDSIENL